MAELWGIENNVKVSLVRLVRQLELSIKRRLENKGKVIQYAAGLLNSNPLCYL